MKKRERDLMKLAKAHGLALTTTARHYAFTKGGKRVAVTSKTPSDWRAWRKLKADLNRITALH